MVCPVVKNAPQSLPVPSPTRMRSVFRAFDCLHCTSADGIKQVISASSAAQNLEGVVLWRKFVPDSYRRHVKFDGGLLQNANFRLNRNFSLKM